MKQENNFSNVDEAAEIKYPINIIQKTLIGAYGMQNYSIDVDTNEEKREGFISGAEWYASLKNNNVEEVAEIIIECPKCGKDFSFPASQL